MNKFTFLIFALACVVVFVIFVIASFFQYGKNGKQYNFFNNFLYELNGFRRYNKKSYIYLATLILLLILLICPYVIFFMVEGHSIIYKSLILVFSIVSSASIFALFFIKLTNYRLHIAFDALLGSSNMILFLIHAIFLSSTSMGGFIFSSKAIYVLIVVLCIVFIVAELLLIVNPSYKKRDKMIKLDNAGYSRPRICYLSILEFGSIIVYFASFIILAISLFA